MNRRPYNIAINAFTQRGDGEVEKLFECMREAKFNPDEVTCKKRYQHIRRKWLSIRYRGSKSASSSSGRVPPPPSRCLGSATLVDRATSDNSKVWSHVFLQHAAWRGDLEMVHILLQHLPLDDSSWVCGPLEYDPSSRGDLSTLR